MKNENLFNVEKYNTVLKEDLSDLIAYLLEDLEEYCNTNGIKLTKKQIQKAINKFKEEYLPRNNDSYYSERDDYERIAIDTSDEYFKEIVEYSKNNS
jgi:hypothetical protein